MSKLKDLMIQQEEHSRIALEAIQRQIKERHEATLRWNNTRHKWSEDMPDLEGEALADAEKQFDYDSWLGEHGIGE